MAGQSRKVKTRIVATRKTAQITKAMNMVSASKLKNAENAIKEYRPFIAKTRDIIVHLASNDSSLKHPLMEKRPIKNICYLLISSDRGLAGAFNSNVCKELTKKINILNMKEAHAADPQSAESLHAAWFRRALGQPEQEDAWQKDVLDALTFDPTWDEQQIMDRMEALLYQYFHRARRSVTDRQWSMWVGRSIGKGRRTSRFVQPNALRRLEQSGGGPDEEETGKKRPHPLSFLQGRTPELILRRYVEDCFGVSMLTPPELAQVERELCTGVHKNCRLHFTKGEPVKHELSRETAWDVETFRQQRKKNRAYYQAHLVENKLIIAQLTQKLQNTILLQSDEIGRAHV